MKIWLLTCEHVEELLLLDQLRQWYKLAMVWVAFEEGPVGEGTIASAQDLGLILRQTDCRNGGTLGNIVRAYQEEASYHLVVEEVWYPAQPPHIGKDRLLTSHMSYSVTYEERGAKHPFLHG